MDNFTATMIAEGTQEATSEAQLILAWQQLIDTGLAWKLQGAFGRKAADLIELGICHNPAPVERDAITDEQDKACALASARALGLPDAPLHLA